MSRYHPMLQVYNTLSRQKEIFKPLTPGKINMYVCGITVYDHCHLGHARMLAVFDTIYRFLCSQGYHVHYVKNITDIDDKIIQRAQELGLSWSELTQIYTDSMHEDEQTLHILPPVTEPKATEHIPEMIGLIEKLLAQGYAYIGSNGDVYFRVVHFKEYGKLSRKDLEGLRAGARVEISQAKEDPLDFVLWKLAKPNEPFWPSPWGNGRPGWHIECSAMSSKYLGQTFDIHGGGMDLQFPHHENEIAQSEGAHQCQFVRYWLHNGFIQVNQEKMSKSLGNFFTIKDALKTWQPEVLRYFLVSSHYRSQVNYSDDSLAQAKASLDRFYQALQGLDYQSTQPTENSPFEQRFVAAMNDDFNTPIALSVLFELAHEIQKNKNQPSAPGLAALLMRLGNIFGILFENPERFLQGNQAEEFVSRVEQLILERNQARADRNFAKADAVREQLTQLGVVLEDSKNGTRWRKI